MTSFYRRWCIQVKRTILIISFFFLIAIRTDMFTVTLPVLHKYTILLLLTKLKLLWVNLNTYSLTFNKEIFYKENELWASTSENLSLSLFLLIRDNEVHMVCQENLDQWWVVLLAYSFIHLFIHSSHSLTITEHPLFPHLK